MRPPEPPAATPLAFEGDGGVRLVGDGYGDPDAPPVMLLHGGGQTRHAWGATAAGLARAGYYAVSLDTRGHGESDWSPDGNYGMESFVADVKAIRARLGRRPALVGASLGGLTAMIGAGESPGLCSAVVLVDIAASAQVKGIQRIVSFMRQKPDGYASLDEVADAIAAYQPQRKRRPNLTGLAKNVRKGEDGRYRWHWDPAFLENTSPEKSLLRPDRLEAAARALRVPTLLVRGKLSDVIGEAEVKQFLAYAPHAEFVDVTGAGHMVAGDENDAFTDAVVGFLTANVPPSRAAKQLGT